MKPVDPDGSVIQELNARHFAFDSADPARLATYLQLPGPEEIDEVTASFIKEFEDQRDELLSPWVKALAFRIDRIQGNRIELENGRSLEATKAYCRQLLQTESDRLVLAAFTVGKSIDRRVSAYLGQDAVFEAYALNQWASVMTEQLRSWVTHSLCGWANTIERALIPYSGPGYNGWDLLGLRQALGLLGEGSDGCIELTDAGMMLPVNSMMIVYAASKKASELSLDESLAQCSRCGMKNCAFRVSPPERERAAGVVGLVGESIN